MTSNIILYGTRSQESETQDYDNFEHALEHFLSEDGYRLDIIFKDNKSVHFYRSPFGEDISEPKFNHPAFDGYHLANAKVTYYNPQKSHDTNNVIKVRFGENND